MRLIIFIITILLFTFLIGCVSNSTLEKPVSDNFIEDNQVTCPKGFKNDPAPGACGIYTDSDNNNICDHSE